jgi:hypothetical protein
MVGNTRSYQAKLATVARHMHHVSARHGDDEAGTRDTAETAAVTKEPLQLKSGASQATRSCFPGRWENPVGGVIKSGTVSLWHALEALLGAGDFQHLPPPPIHHLP